MANKITLAMLALVALAILASIAAYPLLPEKIVSHWDINGQPDSTMDKTIALSIMPAAAIFILALYLIIPKIDPLKDNIKKFEMQYGLFFALLLFFMLYVHILTILWNLGYAVNISIAIIPAVAALFFAMGMLLKDAKRNWFVGVRTPWTMSSDSVWEKTHVLASKTFKVAAVLLLLSVFLPSQAMPIIIAAIVAAALIPVVYSYMEYNKEKKGKSN
jgi:uncharacterized membrane protein